MCSSTGRQEQERPPQFWPWLVKCMEPACAAWFSSSMHQTTEASALYESRSLTLPARGQCSGVLCWFFTYLLLNSVLLCFTTLTGNERKLIPHQRKLGLLLCSNKFKLVILDECDAMTRDAQFALRRGTPEPHDPQSAQSLECVLGKHHLVPIL